LPRPPCHETGTARIAVAYGAEPRARRASARCCTMLATAARFSAWRRVPDSAVAALAVWAMGSHLSMERDRLHPLKARCRCPMIC
jgi:hypothetical protein